MKFFRFTSVCVCLVLFSVCQFAWSAQTKEKTKPVKPIKLEIEKVKDGTVSVKASAQPVNEVLESVAKQAKQKLVIETTVSGNIDLTLNKVSFDQALDNICTAAKLQWREVYLAADSEYLSQPDKLASIVRLTTGIGLPDVVVSKSSVGQTGVHTSDKVAVDTAYAAVIDQLKLVPVYIVTNDLGVSSKTGNQSKVDEFVALSKKQMDMLMNMSPEDLEKALLASLSLSEQMDPRYMANVMSVLMRSDPVALRRAVSRQNEMIFSMSQEDRRAMIKLGMQLQTTLTPEQIQIMTEDAKAVMAEIEAEKGQ
jgi:hypothetical protein